MVAADDVLFLVLGRYSAFNIAQIQFDTQQHPGNGVHEKIKDIEWTNEFACRQHLQFFPQMGFGYEWAQTQGECKENEECQGLPVDPVHDV